MELKDKVAVITGASRGIGQQIALDLAKEGMKLALIARNKELLEITASECRKTSSHVMTYSFDLAQILEIPNLLRMISFDFKRIDVLINDAGKFEWGDPLESDLRRWDETLDINFRAIYHLTNQALHFFKFEQESAVVNICSISGFTIAKGGEIYNASKHALKGYAGCLFESMREKGVKVISIYPGYVNTDMASGEDAGVRERMIQPKDVSSAVTWSLKLPATSCATDITIRPQRSPYQS